MHQQIGVAKMCNTVSGRFAGALQVGNEEACSRRQAIFWRLDRRLSNFPCRNLFGLQPHLDVNVYDTEAMVLQVSAVCREEACIELFQMPISLKMCYVIITCNEVLFKCQ